MKLVPDVKNWSKWWSVRWGLVSAAISTMALTYTALPERWTGALPDWLGAVLAAAALLSTGASVVLRGAVQPKLEKD